MAKKSVLLVVFVLALMVYGLAGSAGLAATQDKPSVPGFTLKFVDASYAVVPTTTVDPYTREQISQSSHTVENKSIEITIKNQYFAASNDSTNLLLCSSKGPF